MLAMLYSIAAYLGFVGSFLYAVARLAVQCRIANNSSLTYLVPLQLKLRFYQDNHFGIAGEQAGQRR